MHLEEKTVSSESAVSYTHLRLLTIQTEITDFSNNSQTGDTIYEQ